MNAKLIPEQQIQGSMSVPTVYIEGSKNYELLINKPQINGVELQGNKTLDSLGIQSSGDESVLSNLEIEQIINSIML